MDVITRETNLYNTQHPDPTTSSSHNISFYDTTSEELKVFLAVSIMMGIVRKPELHLYWSKDGLLETPFFSKTIPKERYIKLLSKLGTDSQINNNLEHIRACVDTLRISSFIVATIEMKVCQP